MKARWSVNDDVENEFRYWVRELLAALRLAAVFAVATGGLIALLPRVEGHPGFVFLKDFWPYLVETAFWLGMFVGMLWSAGKRLGAGLAGTLPWKEAESSRADTGRFFGQWSAFAALLAFSLWLASHLAQAAQLDVARFIADGLAPVITASWLAAGLFALISFACRPSHHEGRAQPGHR